MTHSSRFLLTAVGACATLVCAMAAESSTPAQNAARPAGQPLAPVLPPLVIIAPTELRTDSTLARGCWVRLFPTSEFKGMDDLTIAGPINMAELHTPLGANWKQKTRSMLVGPKATVTVFEGENFHAREATFKPGVQITDMRQALPNVMAINSLRITCGA